MTAQSFRADYKGIGEMLKGKIGLAAVMPKAEQVRATAEATAPYYEGDHDHYKDHFSIEVGEQRQRAVVTVVNDSGHALAVEFGRGNTPRHRTLGKALGVAK